jgi:hypothetical protein
MGATWDPQLIRRVGEALGVEAKARGRNMLLGPCININRVPVGGRSFESFGEDPYLMSRMAVGYIQGVQSQKVIACAKHYAANNQEFERTTIDEKVDERTLREIYLPAFKAAVQEGGALSVMSAYNKLNGHWCSENADLLTGILKKEWGFSGFVVSDWGAVHSTVPTANAGLDIEMPTGEFLNAAGGKRRGRLSRTRAARPCGGIRRHRAPEEPEQCPAGRSVTRAFDSRHRPRCRGREDRGRRERVRDRVLWREPARWDHAESRRKCGDTLRSRLSHGRRHYHR